MAKRAGIIAEVLDERVELGFSELCQLCAVHAELVIELVDEGILQPRGRSPRQWRFKGSQVRRIQTALRLQRDLGVNLPGAALALDLLDEVERLRRRHRLPR